MKILYVTSVPLEYSSSANMRNLALITGIISLGHEVHTLSYKPEKDSAYYDKSLLDVKFKKRYFVGLGRMHSMFTSKKSKNKIKKILYKFYRGLSIYDTRKDIVNKIDEIKIKEQYDIIISSSDPKSSHLFTEKLIERFPNITKRWIQYWGDPFANDVSQESKIPKFIIRHEENRILSKCDKIVYVSPFTEKNQKKLFSKNKEKMTLLPIPYKQRKIYQETNNAELSLGYFGDYYSKNRTIQPLYEAARDLKINLNICGNSDIKLENTEKIMINQRMSKKEIEEYEKNSDILVCVCNKKGTQIPGKVYHYAATNKPILIIVDGEYSNEMKNYFKEFNRYVICSNNKESIKEAIFFIKNNKVNYGERDCFNATNIAKEFLK